MDPQQAPLTRADLDQAVSAIIAAVRGELERVHTRIDAVERRIDAVEQSLTARIDAVEQSLTARIDAVEQSMIARVEAAEHAAAANLSDLRTELVERLERLERRTERIEINVNAMLAQMAGISKSLTLGEQFDSATAGTLAGIKRTIDELARRIDGLEKAS